MVLVGGAAPTSQAVKPNGQNRWIFVGIALGLFVLVIVILSAWCFRCRFRHQFPYEESFELNTDATGSFSSRRKRNIFRKRPILHDVYLDRLISYDHTSIHKRNTSLTSWDSPTEEKTFWTDYMPLTVSRAKRIRTHSRSRSRPSGRPRRQENPPFNGVSPPDTEVSLTAQDPPEGHSLFTNFPPNSLTHLREPKRMHVAVFIAMPSAPPSFPHSYSSRGSNALPSMEIGCTYVPILSKKRRRDVGLGRITTS